MKSAASQDDIRTIHEECIKEFLDNQAQSSFPWYRRLFGCQSLLDQISNSSNYLILFRSLMSVPASTKDKKTELDIARTTALALLKEYQGFWFISSERHDMATQLIKDLEQVTDLATMIKMLDTYQVNLVKRDTETNKSRWFSLHFFSSRLQNTISSALNLASSLHNESSDNYKKLIEAFDRTDENNKGVIRQQIKTYVNLREGFFTNRKIISENKEKQVGDENIIDLDDALRKTQVA